MERREERKGEAISRAARAEASVRRRQQAHLGCYEHLPCQRASARRESALWHICRARSHQTLALRGSLPSMRYGAARTVVASSHRPQPSLFLPSAPTAALVPASAAARPISGQQRPPSPSQPPFGLRPYVLPLLLPTCRPPLRELRIRGLPTGAVLQVLGASSASHASARLVADGARAKSSKSSLV